MEGLRAYQEGPRNWSLALREGDWLSTLEHVALKGMFRPKSEEVSRGCSKLHEEELYGLYLYLLSTSVV